MTIAFEKLKAMTAATAEPLLSNEELEEILASCQTEDPAGASPQDPEWVPTYNLRAAAREGWKRKAAKAAELISTDLDGDRMSANQVFEHCERMVRMYAGTASVSVGPVKDA